MHLFVHVLVYPSNGVRDCDIRTLQEAYSLVLAVLCARRPLHCNVCLPTFTSEQSRSRCWRFAVLGCSVAGNAMMIVVFSEGGVSPSWHVVAGA